MSRRPVCHFAVHSVIEISISLTSLSQCHHDRRPIGAEFTSLISTVLHHERMSGMEKGGRVREGCLGTEVTLSSYPEESVSSEQGHGQSRCYWGISEGHFNIMAPCCIQWRTLFKENTNVVLLQCDVIKSLLNHRAAMLRNRFVLHYSERTSEDEIINTYSCSIRGHRNCHCIVVGKKPPLQVLHLESYWFALDPH